jgi:ribonuclease BN (tRNA processing enzyme)
MEVTFLGSSNAFASEGRYWSSFIVDRKYQFDAPPTLLPQLKQLKVPLEDIEVLFISHGHGDHFIGLPFLMLEYMYMTKREKDLYIVGPPNCEEWLEDFSNRVYPNITRDAGYKRNRPARSVSGRSQ